jgi:hypothetical protein
LFFPFLALPGGVPPCPGGRGVVVVLGVVAVVVTVVVVVLVLVLELDDGVLVVVLGVDVECSVELVGCDELLAGAAGAEADEPVLLEPPLARA